VSHDLVIVLVSFTGEVCTSQIKVSQLVEAIHRTNEGLTLFNLLTSLSLSLLSVKEIEALRFNELVGFSSGETS
jgi:hypothetical protein